MRQLIILLMNDVCLDRHQYIATRTERSGGWPATIYIAYCNCTRRLALQIQTTAGAHKIADSGHPDQPKLH